MSEQENGLIETLKATHQAAQRSQEQGRPSQEVQNQQPSATTSRQVNQAAVTQQTTNNRPAGLPGDLVKEVSQLGKVLAQAEAEAKQLGNSNAGNSGNTNSGGSPHRSLPNEQQRGGRGHGR